MSLPSTAPARAAAPPAAAAGSRLPAAVMTALLGVAVNLTLAYATVAALDVADGYDPLSAPAVVGTTVFAVAAATLLLAVLRRRSRRPRRLFTVLVTAGALLSLGGPLSLLQEPQQYPQATAGVVALTALLHLTTAAVVLAVLPRRTGTTS